MSEVWTWAITVFVVLLAAGTLLVGIERFSRRSIDKKYQNGGGGLGGAFDAVWSPTAHEAAIERDRQTQRTAPAPSPGDPPNTIDDGRIQIDI